jgi:hypothetical protein
MLKYTLFFTLLMNLFMFKNDSKCYIALYSICIVIISYLSYIFYVYDLFHIQHTSLLSF